MLRSPFARAVVFSVASCVCVVSLPAQNSAPAQESDPSSPQLTIRTTEKSTSVVSPDSQNQPDAQKYIAREFGPGYLLAKGQPVLLGDLDGDGLEDAVFIVTGGSPMIGSGAFNYTVLDPYDGFWSFGDPKLNTHVAQTDAGPHYYVLVVHDWRGEKAKGKYVFINLPFKQIALSPTKMGAGLLKKNKKVVAAIATVENDGQQGAVFWNGHTYKFVQLGNQDD